MVLLTDDQHEVFKILLNLMLRLIKNKHFDSSVYKNVMTNYYNTHASNWSQMGQTDDKVQVMLNVQKNGARALTEYVH